MVSDFGVVVQVNMLKRSTQDLFSCPGFMLHTFSDQTCDPEPSQDSASSSGPAEQPVRLDTSRITETYNALLQVSKIIDKV